MSKQLFDFKSQLAIGNVGEKEFQKHYRHLGPKKSEDNNKIDFILQDGSTVELKTDTYDMGATENFFMELYSDMDKGTIGGPWRASRDNIKFFVYYFQKNKTFFWFETKILMPKLEEILLVYKLKLKKIRNKGWDAQGYCVPRELLQEIYKKENF